MISTHHPTTHNSTKQHSTKLNNTHKHTTHRIEKLFGANAYDCSQCKKKTTAERNSYVQTVPSVLTVQLKRFCHVKGSSESKLNHFVEYPIILDLSPFLSENDVEGENKIGEGEKEVEVEREVGVEVERDSTIKVRRNSQIKDKFGNIIQHENLNQNKRNFSGNRKRKTRLNLFAVVVHLGCTLNNGHYVAYVLCSTSNRWYRTDDTSVTYCEEKEVLSQIGAYVLFYEQRKQSQHVSSSTTHTSKYGHPTTSSSTFSTVAATPYSQLYPLTSSQSNSHSHSHSHSHTLSRTGTVQSTASASVPFFHPLSTSLPTSFPTSIPTPIPVLSLASAISHIYSTAPSTQHTTSTSASFSTSISTSSPPLFSVRSYNEDELIDIEDYEYEVLNRKRKKEIISVVDKNDDDNLIDKNILEKNQYYERKGSDSGKNIILSFLNKRKINISEESEKEEEIEAEKNDQENRPKNKIKRKKIEVRCRSSFPVRYGAFQPVQFFSKIKNLSERGLSGAMNVLKNVLFEPDSSEECSI